MDANTTITKTNVNQSSITLSAPATNSTQPGANITNDNATRSSTAITPANDRNTFDSIEIEKSKSNESTSPLSIHSEKDSNTEAYIEADKPLSPIMDTTENPNLNTPCIPPAPPLPDFPRTLVQKRRESRGTTTATTNSSNDSEGRHPCPNGITYPSLDELLKFGRITRHQLEQVEEQFNSEEFHCLPHFICEGIYHSTQITSSDRPAIEDYVPLARNEFNNQLTSAVSEFYRTRSLQPHSPKLGEQTEQRKKRDNPLRHRAVPKLELSSSRSEDKTIRSHICEQKSSESTSLSEVQSPTDTIEPTSPQRQRANRVEAHLDESEIETTKPRRTHRDRSLKNFNPSQNALQCMTQADRKSVV